jgi:hypothetical protein
LQQPFSGLRNNVEDHPERSSSDAIHAADVQNNTQDPCYADYTQLKVFIISFNRD